jgi:competence protein ComEC
MPTRLGAGLRCLALIAALCLPLTAFGQAVTPDARVTRGVLVRLEPLTGSPIIGALAPGQSASLNPLAPDAPGWTGVTLLDGTSGFVSKAWTDIVGEVASDRALLKAAPIYRLHAVDVGTGLALFIEGPDFALVYDAGSNDDRALQAKDRFVTYLRHVRPDLKTIDHVIASHPHQDHILMLPDVLRSYAVRNVWESGRFATPCVYRDFLEAVAASNGTLYHQVAPQTGDRRVDYAANCDRPAKSLILHEGSTIDATPVPLGAGAQMTFLYRNDHAGSDANDNSLVTRIDLGLVRILLTGDAGGGDRKDPTQPVSANSPEGVLLRDAREAIKADVMVMGHHGSMTSSRAAFVQAVGARIFVISSGPLKYSGNLLPDPQIVAEVPSTNLFRTDLDDAACARNKTKIGPDADQRAGGCDNVIVTIQGDQITPGYLREHD